MITVIRLLLRMFTVARREMRYQERKVVQYDKYQHRLERQGASDARRNETATETETTNTLDGWDNA